MDATVETRTLKKNLQSVFLPFLQAANFFSKIEPLCLGVPFKVSLAPRDDGENTPKMEKDRRFLFLLIPAAFVTPEGE